MNEDQLFHNDSDFELPLTKADISAAGTRLMRSEHKAINRLSNRLTKAAVMRAQERLPSASIYGSRNIQLSATTRLPDRTRTRAMLSERRKPTAREYTRRPIAQLLFPGSVLAGVGVFLYLQFGPGTIFPFIVGGVAFLIAIRAIFGKSELGDFYATGLKPSRRRHGGSSKPHRPEEGEDEERL